MMLNHSNRHWIKEDVVRMPHAFQVDFGCVHSDK